MAPAICPNGHTSDSTDYCDTCGSPIGPAAATPASAPPAAEAKPMGVVCPNCEVMNAPGALFCEACGYDYTTGTMPRLPAPSLLDLDTPLPESSPAQQAPAELPADQGGDDSAGAAAATAAPATTAPAAGPSSAASAPPAPPAPRRSADLDIDTPAPAPQPPAAAQQPAPDFEAPTAGASAAGAPPAPEPESDTFDWVVEIWVDPEWYALQDSPDPMPSAGLPDIMPLRKRSLLIGRPSRSRNINPDIDCEPDTGISRRQAQLSTDGTRWFIEDLGSANGTFVADASGGLPSTPIPSGRRRELTGDERIYLGAWTRLVLRRATPEEREAYASA